MAQSRRWTFTLNTWTEEEAQVLRDAVADPQIKYLIFGREIGLQNGRPHLQGYVIFSRNYRRVGVLRVLGARLALFVARGTSQQNREYCIKDGDFEEYGQFPDEQGKRTDLERAIQWADEFHESNRRVVTLRDVAESLPTIAIKYKNFIEVMQARFKPEPLIDINAYELREWQSRIEERLTGEPDDRSIEFIVDIIGGKGKSFFASYMESKYPEKVQVLSVAKRDDLAYMLDESKSIFFFNVPRGSIEFLQYSILEMLKDRRVVSPKYQSRIKLFPKTHVICLCNEYPDMTKLSADRYIIEDLN